MAIDVITFQIDVGHLEDELVHQQMVLGTFKFCECGVVLQCLRPCRTKFKFCEEVLLLQCEQFCSPPYKTRGHSTAFFFLGPFVGIFSPDNQPVRCCHLILSGRFHYLVVMLPIQ